MKILKKVHNDLDTHLLQEDLIRFQTYCILNKLQLNVSKCYHVTYTRKKTLIGTGYTLYGQTINKVNTIRDLGVIFDSKLLFDQHIESIVKKAAKALGFITRMSANFRSIKTIKIIYCSFVRSHLEYASQVWNPQYEIYNSRIEAIQKKFLKYIDFKARQYSADYSQRCHRYHFLPLEHRRLINDICFLLNIANGTIDCAELVAKLELRTNQLGLRQRPLLNVPFSCTNYRRNAFFARSTASFNKLPLELNIDLYCTSASTTRRILAKQFFEN